MANKDTKAPPETLAGEQAAAGTAADNAKVAALADTAPEKPTRTIVPLSINRRQIKEYRNPGLWVCVPFGTTVEDLLEPAFWSHVARDLKPNTTVEVHWDDTSQFAELYVTAAARTWASVSLLRHVQLAKPNLPEASKRFVVKWSGPVDRFQVIRLSDNAAISSGHDSEVAAHQYLREYLQKIAA